MSDSNPPRTAFKVRIGDYLTEHELEGLGISADWFLYLSPTIAPALATSFTQFNTYDLLACPCCGGSATIIGTHPTNEFSAICRDCGLETAHKMTPKDAASDWNKRHAPDEEGAALRAQPAGGGEDAEWRRRYHDRCRVISDWHQRAVALGYEGVNDLLTLALPCIVNNAGDERALTQPQPVDAMMEYDKMDAIIEERQATQPEPVDAGLEAKARAMFEAQADKLAMPWDRQWEPTKRYWREKASTPPESGGQGEARWLSGELRAIGNNLGLGGATVRTIRAAADELERLTHPTAQASGAVTEAMVLLDLVARCAYPVCRSIDPRGYRWSEAYLDEVLPRITAALAQGGGNER